MELTHSFKLNSGVPCVIKELAGKQQRILTEQKTQQQGENVINMIESVLVSVGSETNPTKEFINAMLSPDRKKILTTLRKVSLKGSEQENKFIFHFEYTDKNGVKQKEELDVDLTDDFPEKPLMDLTEDGKLVPVQYNDYSEIKRLIVITLPKTKKIVRFRLLDGNGETVGSNVKKENRSSHTTLEMRNPQELKEGGTDTWMQLHLDSLPLLDIEHLRKKIKEVEGEIDTVVEFDHPEAQFKVAQEKKVRVDLVTQTAFFFPSEAI
jgi:hypothetical protein